MDINALEAELKNTLFKNKVEVLSAVADQDVFSVKDLIDLTFHMDGQIAFRAAWILENISVKSPNRFLPLFDYFLDRYHQQDNLSARRHYAKILARFTKQKNSKEIKDRFVSYPTDLLVETNFNWLIDKDVPVAVKSHCLNILANFVPKHAWVKEELLQTMDFLVDKESIAFYAKVKQIRKQLK